MALALKNPFRDSRSWAGLAIIVLCLTFSFYSGFDWVFAVAFPLLWILNPRTYQVTTNAPSAPPFAKWGFGVAILVIMVVVSVLGCRIASHNPEMGEPVMIAVLGFTVVVIGAIAWAARIALIRRAAKRQEILKDL
jgi:hypothetical protein